MALTEPWVQMAADAIERSLTGSPLLAFVSPRDLAYTVTTFYLGANLLSELVPEEAPVPRLLDAADRLAPMLDMLSPGSAR